MTVADTRGLYESPRKSARESHMRVNNYESRGANYEDDNAISRCRRER